MAVDSKDCLKFQVGSLPSGSISFGRFELESLSWERKSSFSHNRYLEEIEKYSTPGSVTQKKAFFEAHFKKKVFVNPDSLKTQNGSQCQTAERDSDSSEEDQNCREESRDHREPCKLQLASAIEEPAVLDSHEHEGNGREETLPSAIPEGCAVYSKDRVLGSSNELVDYADIHETQYGYDSVPLNKDESNAIVEHKSENLEGFPETRDSSSLKDNDPSAREMEETSMIELPSDHLPRKASTEKNRLSSGKEFIKILREMRDALRTKSEKQPSLNVPGPSVSGETWKSEDSGSQKPKVEQEHKSEKGRRRNKAGDGPQSSCIKSKRDASLTKTEVKQHMAAFSFRSDERAEKRKEFAMKLEEKFQAKEAQMNENLVRTQEEAEAEIKQLRKNLNFKATPMPSFYQKASDGKKLIPAPTKSTKPQTQSKCMSMKSGTPASVKKITASSKSVSTSELRSSRKVDHNTDDSKISSHKSRSEAEKAKPVEGKAKKVGRVSKLGDKER